MIGNMYHRLWRPPRRVVSGVRYIFQEPQSLHPDTPQVQTKRGPVPPELLRFALLRTVQPGPGAAKSSLERDLRETFLEEWAPNTSPSPLWTSWPKVMTTYSSEIFHFIDQAQNLQDLQFLIERSVIDAQGGLLFSAFSKYSLAKALARCERQNTYGDILLFINGLETRIRRLGSPVPENIYILGIYYACLAFSDTALEHHLRGYLTIARDRVGLGWSRDIVKALLSSFQTLAFQDPKADTSRMRRLITGEADSEADSEAPSLRSILYWIGSEADLDLVGEYLSLLVKAQSDTLHLELWDKYLNTIGHDSSSSRFQSAYVYAMALVDAGNSSSALTVLAQTSGLAKNTLPDISTFKDLNTLLECAAISEALPRIAGEKEYMSILEVRLRNIEERLGITWRRRRSLHTGISDPHFVASDQPILTIDGDGPGYESAQRLTAEIQALGCSKSIADIRKIADLLDDYEGQIVPVSIPFWGAFDAEFYWAPQRSPVELCTDSSLSINDNEDRSPSTLGLVKVISSRKESPFALERSLHLLQLGYLLKKQTSPSEGGQAFSFDLVESGHIVTWDRVSGQFLVVFAGKGLGPIDPSTEFETHTPPCDISAIAQMIPLKRAQTVSRKNKTAFRRVDFRRAGTSLEVDTFPTSGTSPTAGIPTYCLAVDPSIDLIFDIHT